MQSNQSSAVTQHKSVHIFYNYHNPEELVKHQDNVKQMAVKHMLLDWTREYVTFKM